MRKVFTNKFKWLVFGLTFFCFSSLIAQKGYSLDSLQIKVYTTIDYVDSTPNSILVKKVFCDYCSENQLNGIGDEALRRTYIERFDKKNKLVDGRKKLALYIRISKSDFAYLENNQEMSLESYLIKNMLKNKNNGQTNKITDQPNKASDYNSLSSN